MFNKKVLQTKGISDTEMQTYSEEINVLKQILF